MLSIPTPDIGNMAKARIGTDKATANQNRRVIETNSVVSQIVFEQQRSWDIRDMSLSVPVVQSDPSFRRSESFQLPLRQLLQLSQL
jgi:hypothetical protein